LLDKEFQKSVFDNISRIADEKGVSDAEISRHIGLNSRQHYNRIKSGGQALHVNLLPKIAELLKVEVEELVKVHHVT
jgi:transcriptional regulator with XRE-family HTH domain